MPRLISIDPSAPSMLTISTIYALTEHISIYYARPPTLLCRVDTVGLLEVPFRDFYWKREPGNATLG